MTTSEIRPGLSSNLQAERQILPPLNEIPEEDFRTRFLGSPEPFRVNQPTERPHFSSMSIVTFGITRGDYGYVVAFMDWVKIHKSFDMKNTFANYLKAGGWKNLSDEEQIDITDAYYGGHRNKKNAPHSVFLSMGEDFDIQMRCLANPDFIDPKRRDAFPEGRLRELTSLGALRIAFAEDIERRLERTTS